MLVHISIKNLAIVKNIELTVGSGFTAITGETGAGKSIALDALGLCLGYRAESNMVREGADKAEVVAHFDLLAVPAAIQFLREHDLQQDDSPSECFIRRIVSNEGRSKAFINGVPVNLTQLKQLGKLIALIHGQHDHYQFLKADNQLDILDQYAQHNNLVEAVQKNYNEYKHLNDELKRLQSFQQQRGDRRQLLTYQVQELDEFSLGETEFSELESEFKRLSSYQDLTEKSYHAQQALNGDEQNNVMSLLQSSIKALGDVQALDSNVDDICETLHNAYIQIEEANNDLEHYISSIEDDPEHLFNIEKRYSQCLDLARKHQVNPEQLYTKHVELADELSKLNADDESLSEIQQDLQTSLIEYRSSSLELNKSRKHFAANLSQEIQLSVREMNLPHAQIEIEINFSEQSHPSKTGNNEVRFMISVNPGQELDILEKVVSGGELSRIGLALQVITSKGEQIPTMVFDEVDTGISGPTASLVGKLLRKLGENAQVMCVTHLPQVAAVANNQLFVNKITDGHTTETQLLKLTKEERVNEIARLLAGDELTNTAIANAKDLLKL